MNDSSDSDSGDDIIPQRRSTTKKVIISDDENDSNPVPLLTEDISLRLSEDDDDERDFASKSTIEKENDSESGDGSSLQQKDMLSNETELVEKESILKKTVSIPDLKKKKPVSKLNSLWDSDSDAEDVKKSSPEPPKAAHSKASKPNSLWDSDSEAEEPKQESPKSVKPAQKEQRSIWDSDSEEVKPAAIGEKSAPSKKKSINLYDSDSDEAAQPTENFKSGPKGHHGGKSNKSAAGKKSRASSKDAMLAIRAESQRMTRESSAALPYHRPKQHSLDDFLNRPRFGPKSIKASDEELLEFQQRLKENEKELKEFYKSESEDSDSDDSKNGDDTKEGDAPTTDEKSTIDQSTASEHKPVDGVEATTSSDSTPINELQTGDHEEAEGERKVTTDVNQSFENAPMDVDENLLAFDTSEKPDMQVADQELEEPAKAGSEKVSDSSDKTKSLQLEELAKADAENVDSVTLQEMEKTAEKVSIAGSPSKTEAVVDEELEELAKSVGGEVARSNSPDELEVLNADKDVEKLAEVVKGNLEKSESSRISKERSNEDKANSCEESELERNEKNESTEKNKMNIDPIPDSDEETTERKKMNIDPISDSDEETTERKKMNIDPIPDSDDEIQEVLKVSEKRPILLKGKPNDVIDLEDFSSEPRNDIESFKERFLRHSITSKPKASPAALSVKVVNRGSDGNVIGIDDEVIILNTEETPVVNVTPGLKMKMLKLELQRKIIEQRDKEFSLQQESGQTDADGNKSDYEDGDDVCELSQKDDEKEVEEDDDDGVDVDCDADEDDDGDDGDDEVEDDDEEEDEEEDEDGLVFNMGETEEVDAGSSRKERQRSSFVDDEAEDDDDEDENSIDLRLNEDTNEEKPDGKSRSSGLLCRTNTNVDMFASQMSNDDDDEDFPAYQPGGGLQNRDKSLKNSSTQRTATQGSQLSSTIGSLKLPDLTLNTQFSSVLSDGEEGDSSTLHPLSLSFERFSGGRKDTIKFLAQSPDAPETEADLMALCSGKFTSQPLPFDSQIDSALLPGMVSQDSQDMELKLTEDSPTDDDASKFLGSARMVIESSDDEEDKENIAKSSTQKEKRKTKRLCFSDDEESNSLDSLNISENEDEEDEGDEEDPLPEHTEVMYDSDENEIPVKGAAFLENEAELSEDDYAGSGDEDEELMGDKMEAELGDQDDIDDDQVREELGRIHMRKMLDEDRRDVRLMQEMLLEDGELHEDGKGRERQFRWRNIDLSTLTSTEKADSEEENEEEEEDEAEWRKTRHAREVFLRDNPKKTGEGEAEEDEEEEEDSELMRLGKFIVAKKCVTRVEIQESKPLKPVAVPESPVKALFHSTRNNRGSFLSRTSDALTRLAEVALGKNGIVDTKPKNSRNFVFSVESPPKESANNDDEEIKRRQNAKRKAKRSLLTQPEKKPCSQSTKYSSLFDHLSRFE